jgi:hypothetical protein
MAEGMEVASDGGIYRTGYVRLTIQNREVDAYIYLFDIWACGYAYGNYVRFYCCVIGVSSPIVWVLPQENLSMCSEISVQVRDFL